MEYIHIHVHHVHCITVYHCACYYTCTVFSPRIIQGMMGARGLGMACSHIRAFGLFPFPHQRKICTEGLQGRHALSMLGRTLMYTCERNGRRRRRERERGWQRKREDVNSTKISLVSFPTRRPCSFMTFNYQIISYI